MLVEMTTFLNHVSEKVSEIENTSLVWDETPAI